MLRVLGILMENAETVVKGIAFDAHQSHVYFRQALFGQFNKDFRQEDLSGVPFFEALEYSNLPVHVLPRLPLQKCYHKGKAVWPLCGPCASSVFQLVCFLFQSFSILQIC